MLQVRSNTQGQFRIMETQAISEFILEEISSITSLDRGKLNQDTVLFGSDGIMKSRDIVELLLAIEEYMDAKFGVEFDWTSDSAMSNPRSVFGSVERLANHLGGLVKAA